MRLFVLILGVILMLPAVAYLGWQGLQHTPGISRVIKDVSAIDDYYADAGKGAERMRGLLDRAWKISAAMGAAGGDNEKMLDGAMGVLSEEARGRAVETFARPDVFGPERQVIVDLVVTPEQFLAPGEALPEDDWLDLYMQTRIATLAGPLCDKLRGTHVADCRVDDFRIERAREKTAPRPWRPAVFTLAVLPLTPEGGLPAAETVPEMTQDWIELVPYPKKKGEATLTLGPDLDAVLTKVFARAEEACAERRRAKGNCMLSQIALDADGHATAMIASLEATKAPPAAPAATN